jgi:hypothetical protein
LTEEEKVALAKGNSKAMIRVNKEVFDYSRVREKDLLLAERWFNAPKPFTGKGDAELTGAYYQWRLWNAAKWSRYKGGLIVEKATGKSVSSPHGEESEEEEEEEEEGSEEEEMTVAMAAVRVE